MTEAMTWGKIVVPERGDIVGVRTLSSGQREFLMHNEALCLPYYVAAEGATTQPIPASEPRPLTKAEKDSLKPFTETRTADIALHYGSLHETKLALKSQIEICNDLRERLRHAEQKLAQPVPSAGSKPEEEGGAAAEMLREVYEYFMGEHACSDFTCDCNKPEICGVCELRLKTQAFLASQPVSQPVADGGGLPPLDDIQIILNLRQQVLFLESEPDLRNAENDVVDYIEGLKTSLASSQEALRVAQAEHGKTMLTLHKAAFETIPQLEERMQQAADQLKPWLRTDCGCAVTEAIKLLSPEGSSR